MESRLVVQLQRLYGWRLWLAFSMATVACALIIVSLMDLALMGRITLDYLLTGLVTAGIVAPASLFLMSTLLREIAKHQRRDLSRSVESAEARLQVALDASDEGVLMVAADGSVLSANKRFFELWRVPPALAASGQDAPLLAHVIDQLVDPDEFLAGVERLYGSDAQANDTLQFKDGRTFERYSRALDLDAEQGRIWCFRDVSVQAQTREALAEQEEKYRAIVNQAGDGIDLIDVETLQFIEVNAAACRMLGYRRDELVGQPVTMILASQGEAALRAAIARVVREGEASFEIRLCRKDGRILDVVVSSRAIRLQGKACLVGVWHDIGERKAAELALTESRNLLQTIINAAPMRVFWKGLDLRYLGCNPAFAQDAGKAVPQDLLGLDDHQLGWADQADSYQADDRAVMASGVAKLFYEEPQTTPDGRTLWLSTSKVPLKDGDGKVIGVIGTYQDITQRKQAEWNLKLAVEVTNIVLWKIDLMTGALEFDQANLPALDLEPDESLTTLQGWLERVHADEAGLFAERFQATMQAGGPVFDLEYRVRRRDDQYRWIHTKGSVIQRSADGRPEFAVGTSMNITARRQAEAELERHRQHLEELVEQRTTALLATEARATRLLESAADGLYGVDQDGRITFMNPAACRMLGHTPEQALGRYAHDLFHHSRPDGSPNPAADCPIRQAWHVGREARVDDDTYWHADGHPVPVALASHPIVEKGEIAGAVVSVVDVSVQRAATLAREQALVAAENLARARSEFLANMSHEIRTPMNGVLGFAHIGRRHHQDPGKALNAFEKILSSGNHMLGVVNDILDFSKIDAGKLHIEASEMSVSDVLDAALQHVADRARAKGLHLSLEKAADLPPTCVSDPLRVGQVLLNLLTNAIKFTEDGSVTLSARRDGGQLVFCVSDTGIGMTADQLGYVFNPFQQADGSTTRKFGGTGLGLAICKRLLELMQGEIRVESRHGGGSLFEVRLPYVQPARPPGAKDRPTTTLPEKPLSGLSILLAEDDEINQKMLEIILVDDGARLVTVGDGAAALARVIGDGPKAYDIVLMDIQMPVMDGYEAARKILALAPDLPIIGQTAHAFDEDRDKCLAAGMAGYVAKPIDQQALAKLVLQVLAGRRPAG